MMENRTKITLADWQAIQNYQLKGIMENILGSNALANILLRNYRPLTKWQRRKLRIKGYLDRLHLAWRALRGDDLNFED